MSRTITISDEDEAVLREFLAHHLQHSRVRAVLALLDAAPPITSTACPNTTETCSTTCAAWEGRACDCKVAPSAVDLAEIDWLTSDLQEMATHANDVTGMRRSSRDLDSAMRALTKRGPMDEWNAAVRDRARAILTARGKVAT